MQVLMESSCAVDACPYLDIALTVLSGRNATDLVRFSESTHAVTAKSGDVVAAVDICTPASLALDAPLIQLEDHVIVDASLLLIEMGSWEVIETYCAIAVVGDKAVPIHLDTRYAVSWHEPKNWREYERSPQKSLWRTSMELKMDKYLALKMWRMVRIKDLPKGTKVLRTLWVFKKKFDGKGIFEKLNPRWCIVGTGMDRDVYDSFSDVLRWQMLLVLVAIRAILRVVITACHRPS